MEGTTWGLRGMLGHALHSVWGISLRVPLQEHLATWPRSLPPAFLPDLPFTFDDHAFHVLRQFTSSGKA